MNRWLLFLLVPVLFLGRLGFDELWSPEGRWAVICRDMLERGDWTDPWEFERNYVDKPMFSYWGMLACARVTGALDELALRLPGALLGIACVALVARIASRSLGPGAASTAAWVLASTVMFVHWSRIATSDIWNVFAVLAGVAWYYERRERPGWITAFGFAAILAVGSMCKGPISAVVTLLAVLPEVVQGRRWRAHAGWHWVPALIAGAALYAAQFFVAGTDAARERIDLMIKDNFTRFYEPWDHKSSAFIYLGYVPLYLLPWSIFLPAMARRWFREWRSLPAASRAWAWSALLVLGFFMAAGSRRSYYILPLVPILALLVADYLGARPFKFARSIAVSVMVGFTLWLCVVKPLFYNDDGGMRVLARELRATAEKQAPYEEWNVILVGTRPSAGFYLAPRGHRPDREIDPDKNIDVLRDKLAARPRSIVVTIQRDREFVDPYVRGWTVLEEGDQAPSWLDRWIKREKHLVAFVPTE